VVFVSHYKCRCCYLVVIMWRGLSNIGLLWSVNASFVYELNWDVYYFSRIFRYLPFSGVF
jgi:hypothetical protein